MDLFQQGNVFAFNMMSKFVITFFSKEQAPLNFMDAVIICSDFEAQENKACHCFHCFPNYLLWSDGTVCHDLSFLNVGFWARTLAGNLMGSFFYLYLFIYLAGNLMGSFIYSYLFIYLLPPPTICRILVP